MRASLRWQKEPLLLARKLATMTDDAVVLLLTSKSAFAQAEEQIIMAAMTTLIVDWMINAIRNFGAY